MNNIKAIFIDIDGTLTTHKNKYGISLEDKMALKDAQKKGIYVVLSTGRSYEDLYPVWKEIGMGEKGAFAIHSAGSVLQDMAFGDVIVEYTMDEFIANKLIEHANANNFRFKMANDKRIFRYKLTMIDKFVNIFKKVVYDYSEFTTTPESFRKIGFVPSFSKRKTLKQMAKFEEAVPNAEFTRTGSGIYIEATKSGISKATAAKIFAKIKEFDLKDAIALGDSMNDYKIFEAVGHPIAMANAQKELKKISKFQTKSVKDSGVSFALKQIKD